VFELADEETTDETASVDDFIRELEEKEKDLHITAETTFIELAAILARMRSLISCGRTFPKRERRLSSPRPSSPNRSIP
jgi:hypothetical protein